ncbi:MAG: aminopeptidase N [Casimicrobium sp.]
MKNPGAVAIHRADYRAPAFWIDRVDLQFDLDATNTRVSSLLALRRNAQPGASEILVLNGDGLTLESILHNGHALSAADYRLESDRLMINASALAYAGDTSTLSIVTRFDPTANLALEGLYVTNGTFCTQCEAEGFRRITYFPDRPDVLSEYRVTIRADKAQFPVLLSNGNLVSEAALDDGRHEAVWHDPHKKPSYLFALVAGKIDRLTDRFATASGRDVLLEIYSTTANLPRCEWAMECLKAAMRWDEAAYGREYDLDRFMIYAADDFNMGAMENKGLNIFNSRFLLADKDTATDVDFQVVDAIVAHEYFHNWSGNRVTCRDWFQLSLKEGFTVFREQQYSAFRGSPAVVRIEETAFMQSRQFAQDAGPMAHPIRPDEYEAIDNFYTVTVYEKGAEVIRMLHTLLGAEAYRKGTDLYFARHDGTAATCDDFVAAMEAASGADLTQFKRWYSQAGTPTIKVSDAFDATLKRYSMTVEQSVPATPGQPSKLPTVIPLSMALVQSDGSVSHAQVLSVTEARQTFHFDGIENKPFPSLLRGFSAPVKVSFAYADDELVTLVAKDSDGVVRWQALRELFFRAFNSAQPGGAPALHQAVNALLADRQTDPALIAQMLTLPSHAELADREPVIDALAIADARDAVMMGLATANFAAMIGRYGVERAALADALYSMHADAVAHRSLANTLLALINVTGSEAGQALALIAWTDADNLTDVMGAMAALRDQPCAARDTMFSAFHDRWLNDLSMLNRWFQMEAGATRPEGAALARVRELLTHPKFDGKNPNRVRAVVYAFADHNWRGFHAADGGGYAFIAEQILRYDAQNPSLAARFCDPFLRWHKCAEPQRGLQKAQLEKLVALTSLSPNVRELIEKALKAGTAAA